MAEDICIGGENKTKIEAVQKQVESSFHTMADTARHIFEMRGDIKKLTAMFYDMKGSLVGDEDNKGIIHELKDSQKIMEDHMEDSNKYRPMIESSYTVTEKIRKSFSTTMATVLSTVARVGTLAILGLLSWHHIIK